MSAFTPSQARKDGGSNVPPRGLLRFLTRLVDAPGWATYPAALALSLCAVAAREALNPILGVGSPFGFLIFCTTFCAFVFGLGEGLTCVAIGIVVGLANFAPPLRSLAPTAAGSIVVITIFAINGAFISLCAGWLRAAVRARIKVEAKLAHALDREHALRERSDAASQTKSRFLAMVSHELRTPLSPVLPIVTEQLGSATPHLTREDLEVIARGVRSEIRLIDDLLDFMRLDHRKQAVRPEKLEVEEAVRQALQTCKSTDGWSGSEPELLFAHDPEYRLVADPQRFQQIVCNLLRNARKFTPRSGRIVVDTFSPVPNRVCVRVRDEGCGISAESLAKIFDPFEQGDEGPASGRGGLGLGLAIAREFADLQGGSLTASSEGPGKGATFVLELPAVREIDPASEPSTPVTSAVAIPAVI